MKSNKLIGFVAVIIFIASLVFGYMLYLKNIDLANLERKFIDAQEKYTVIQKTLTGYTSFTSYSSLLTKSLSEQMKFIGAKTRREYEHFENIKVKKYGLGSNAALGLQYIVEYVIGYDLGNGNFKLDANEKGITLHLKKPEMVALPSVVKSDARTLSGGLLIDEKQETINLLNKLPEIVNANNRTSEILQDEAVIALCEKKIKEFIRNVLISQYKTEIIPEVTIIYF